MYFYGKFLYLKINLDYTRKNSFLHFQSVLEDLSDQFLSLDDEAHIPE